MSKFENVRVLDFKGTHLTKRESDMFTWGRVVAVHKVGEHEIIEYLDRKVTDYTVTRELTNTHMFHVNGVGESCDSLDKALLVAIAVKYDGLNSQAARLFVNAIQMDKSRKG